MGTCLQILDTFKDWQFFYGESGVDGGGMVAVMNFREDGVTPYMLFFKDGVVEEKVVSTCRHCDMCAKGSLSIMHFVLDFSTCAYHHIQLMVLLFCLLALHQSLLTILPSREAHFAGPLLHLICISIM